LRPYAVRTSEKWYIPAMRHTPLLRHPALCQEAPERRRRVPQADSALHPRPLVALLARQALASPRRISLQGDRRDRGPRGADRDLRGRSPRGSAALRVGGPSTVGRPAHGEGVGRLGPARPPAARQPVGRHPARRSTRRGGRWTARTWYQLYRSPLGERRAGAATPRPFLLPLFTGVRGRMILRTSGRGGPRNHTPIGRGFAGVWAPSVFGPRPVG